MNTFVKAAIAGALSLSATCAFAAVGDPWSNSSDLILVVENASTHAAYVLDTGVSLDTLLPTASLKSGAVLDYSITNGVYETVAASSTFQSFLAANPASGDLWTLEGGQYNGNSSATATSNDTKVAGGGKMVIASQTGTNNNATVSAKQLGNLDSFLNGLQQDIHAPPTPPGLNPLESASETGAATVSTDISAEARYGFFTANDFSSLGNPFVQLFGFTGNGTTGKLQSYILGEASLSTDGTLSFGQVPLIPLPAAIWLLGSGLLGLFGVSRRRAARAA
jgi:hypothetical protein